MGIHYAFPRTDTLGISRLSPIQMNCDKSAINNENFYSDFAIEIIDERKR